MGSRLQLIIPVLCIGTNSVKDIPNQGL